VVSRSARWYAACSTRITMRNLFQTILPRHLLDVTGGSKRVSVRPNNDDLVQKMNTLKSDIETVGKAQIDKQSKSSQMLPMMMMMMQRR
jgi:hypothetical protein